ncbi:MAG: hypothetical protein AB7O97_05825 [Planctomycetota bacterium]
MRNLMLCGWLLVPIGAWAYHEGPGQDGLARDRVADTLQQAFDAATHGDHAGAVKFYEAALDELPDGDLHTARHILLELSKSRMQDHGLPTARAELAGLVEELDGAAAAGSDEADPELLAEAREALANAQYYTTWLMRLEGLPRERWEPEIEAARQNYRLLAERAGDETAVARHQSDLESAVKLARLELEDLQGLPLPSE